MIKKTHIIAKITGYALHEKALSYVMHGAWSKESCLAFCNRRGIELYSAVIWSQRGEDNREPITKTVVFSARITP